MVGKPFWVSEAKMTGFLHLGLVLAFLAANAGVAYFINKTSGAWMDAIQSKNKDDFFYYLACYAGLILLATPIQVFYGYFRTRLALVWRRWLSTSLFVGYFSNLAYLKLTRDKTMDNPDQRMAQDVDSFCNSSVGLFISLIDAVVNVVMFAGVLYMLSGTLTLTVIAYSAIGSIIVIWVGKALVNLTNMQMKTEADLRFGLAEVRREAETVALYRGEELAQSQAKTRLGRVIDTLMSIMNVNRNIQLFTAAYYMFVPIIPAAIIAPLYFDGSVAFGDISRATGAFQAVFNGATILIGQFGGITAFAAIINRLGSFREAVDASGVEQLPPGKYIEVTEGAEVVFDKVTITTPETGRNLIVDLALSVQKGKSMLVTGPDGSGKSSLLRVLTGIWSSGSGKLQRPATDEVLFLDKSPYLPPMTLREALCFPVKTTPCADERLQQILNLVDLGDLPKKVGGFEIEQNWRETLSPSQQQRLALARVINLKPKYVIIDEASAALEAENEKLLYQLLTTIGATFVSAGNGNTLAKYHTQVLELAGDGSWKLYPASEYQPKTWRSFQNFIPKFLLGDKDEEK
jgi:putative ATP-binding cassette transporter